MKKTSLPSKDPNVAAKQVLDNFLGIHPSTGKVMSTKKATGVKKVQTKKK